MDTDIFKRRTSIRQFRPDDVSLQIIEQLLKAAVDAPSAGNCQPWHFYVVRNNKIKAKLSACAHNQKSVKSAPVAIVVCAEPSRSYEVYGDRGAELYAIQDTAAAVENLLLCAAMLGLGACWCGAFDETAVSTTLRLPEYRRPVAIVPVGYPAGVAIKPARRAYDETISTIY